MDLQDMNLQDMFLSKSSSFYESVLSGKFCFPYF